MRIDPFGKEVLRLAVPAFGALAAPSLLIITDSAFVGSLGTRALAGLATGGAAFGAAVGLSYFLAYATTSVVARRYGAREEREAIADGVNYITLGLIIGTFSGVLLWRYAETLSRWIGASPDVLPSSVQWMHAAAWGTPAVMASMATIGLFRGLQDTRITFVVTTVQVSANIALCAWFIFIANMGIAGAGIAWAISENLGFAMYFTMLARHARRLHVPFHPTHLHGLGEALRVGLPLLWRSITMRVVLMGTTVVASRLGTQELAAFNVSLQMWYLLANLLDAVAIAAQAIVGKRLGAAEGHLVHALVARLLRWARGYGALVGLVTMALAPIAPLLFSRDATVQHLLMLCLLVVGAQAPLGATVFLLDGVLVGSGDTKYLAFVLTMAMCAFLPIAWAVVHWHLGVLGLWSAMLAFLMTRAALLTRRAHGDAWIVEGATR